MKKIINYLLIFLMITCSFVLFGCNDRYSNLGISLSFTYSNNLQETTLEDGTIRVSNGVTAFDKRLDGSYVFYIEENKSVSAYLDVTYTNIPDNFNYGISFTSSNIDVASCTKNFVSIENGTRANIIFSQKGQSELTIINNECNKSKSIYIEVVELVNEISFVNNTLAISKIEQNKIDFKGQINGVDNNLSGVSLYFGLGVNENFSPFSDNELRENGFSYDAKSKELILDRTDIRLDNLVVKAVYSSPLGEELEAFLQIKILANLENFEIYRATSLDQISESNLLNNDSIVDLIYNMSEANYVDLALKVKSNKELVSFALLNSSAMPVTPTDSGNYIYTNSDGEIVDTYSNATLTYYFVRLYATKSTEEMTNKVAEVVFECGYKDYIVQDYPIRVQFLTKIYNLVKAFSINNEKMQGLSFDDDNLSLVVEAYKDSFYKSDIYLDSSIDILGEKFEIDVAEPMSIAKENAKFLLEFYDASLQKIVNPTEKLSIVYEYDGIKQQIETTDLSRLDFEKGTNLYIKPTSSNNNGDIIYMVVRAKKPEKDFNQTVAFCELTVRQGLREITKVDYSYLSFAIDEHGNYILDENNQKQIDHVEENDVEFVNDENSKNYILSKDINLGIDVPNQQGRVKFYFTPEDAILNNLSISSTSNILEITEDLQNNCFYFTPKLVGSTQIVIDINSLSIKYIINVNVYTPINSFYVRLNHTQGVGSLTLNEDDGISVASAIVEVGASFSLLVNVQPKMDTYDIKYNLYLDGESRTLLGYTLCSYNGLITTIKDGKANGILEDLGLFAFDAKRKTFSFYSSDATEKTYILEAKIINFNGAVITKEIELNCYSPLSQIVVKSSKSNIFDANNIYYEDKIISSQNLVTSKLDKDDSAFGLQIETFGKSNQKPTYDFDNYGKIELFLNQELQARYLVKNGNLQVDFESSTCKIDALSSSLIDGKYYFRLNENYSYPISNISQSITVVVTVEYESFIKQNSIFVNIVKTNQTQKLSTYELINNDINFRQGIDKTNYFNVVLDGENLKNQNILTKIFGLIQLNDITYYLDLTDDEFFDLTTNKIRENEYKLSLSAKQFLLNNAVLLICSQDRINTQTQYELWNNFDYVNVEISEEDFVSGIFYTKQDEIYVLATTYSESDDYYIKSINFNNVVNIWQNMLAVNISISDGINVPYHISSVSELLDVSATSDAVTKKYVLTRDIDLSNYNFSTLGNYYKVEVTNEDYIPNYYYVYQNGSYVLDSASEFDETAIYYDYGFNGEFSGKYVINNLKTGTQVVQYFKLYNVKYEGKAYNFGGIFSKIGQQGIVEDLQVDYAFYSPNYAIKEGMTSSETFANVGGIAGENYGRIVNCKVNFEIVNITTSGSLNFGGISGKNIGDGENTGIITNTIQNSLSSVRGKVTINVSKTEVDGTDDRQIYVGGIVGYNSGYVGGSSIYSDEINYAFDEMGFDLNLDLIVNYATGVTANDTSGVGGLAGYNNGKIENFSTSGSITAKSSNNVGGLIGYNTNVNSQFDLSVYNSYSTMIVEGNKNVGGAIGCMLGKSGTDKDKVIVKYVSSENYFNSYKPSRNLVEGTSNVGGLVGYSRFAIIQYCYFASYYDCSKIESTYANKPNYDVVGTNYVGGLIGRSEYNNLEVSASYVNVYSNNNNVNIFLGSADRNTRIVDCFGIGNIYTTSSSAPSNLNLGITSPSNSYGIVYFKNQTYVNGSSSTDIDSIKDNIELNASWKIEENVNNGLPYLLDDTNNALFAMLPLTIQCEVKDASDYEDFIKNNNTSVILLLASDENNRYSMEEINRLNTISLLDILDIEVFAKTYKTSKLSAESDNKSVLTITNGIITLLKEGKATIKIYSKISSDCFATIDVVVMTGLSDVKVYANSSLTLEIDEEAEQEISSLRSKSLTFYAQTNYQKDGYELKSSKNVGLRFVINNDEFLANILNSLNNNTSGMIYSLQDILNINRLDWRLYNNESDNYYYVDVEDATALHVNTNLAIDGYLNISIIPFVKKEFKLGFSQIILDKLEVKHFKLSINNGCQDIVVENNISQEVEINQLENFTFTITIFTDYEDDQIVTDINTYADKIGYSASSPVYTREDDGTLKSISITYTVWYKDKVNPIENKTTYPLKFWPLSNADTNNSLVIYLTVIPQDGINDIAYKIYSEYNKDYPQLPSINNIVYNGKTALLALEIYPYFATYSKLRITYNTASSYPLTISQLKYDASGSNEKFVYYSEGGSYVDDRTGALFIEKSSGQDSYLINTGGVYSYSKSYFFGLLVPSDVIDRSVYIITIQVLDKSNKVMMSKDIYFTTLSKGTVKLSFEETYKGEDNLYYLPVNTTQKLDIQISSEYKNMFWSVSSRNYELSNSAKELFIPKYENGEYFVQIMNYEDGEFSTDLIGKTITLTLYLDSSEVTDPTEISFVISLFTVTNVLAEKVNNNYMTLDNLTTVPLEAKVEAIYDQSLSESDNWYKKWYKDNANNESDNLYILLKNAGYEITETFEEIIAQLEVNISTARYSNEIGAQSQSGVWFYVDEKTSQNNALTIGVDYNNKAFGVQEYNNYFAIHGYKIDKSSNMKFFVRISYSHFDAREQKFDSKGIPNVKDYNFDTSLFTSVFSFGQNYIMNFISSTQIDNYIPVSNAQEFLELNEIGEGNNYRLVNDIVLSDYTPYEAKFNIFDGNNYKIYITSFSQEVLTKQMTYLGLFTNVNQNCMVQNTTVYYTSGVDKTTSSYNPRLSALNVNVNQASSIIFGGIVALNNGIITNCTTTGGVNLTIYDINNQTKVNSLLIGSLVGNNASTGYITNSQVQSFNLVCYGNVGGFVGTNSGKIVASYFENSQINNLSNNDIGGFVYRNLGEIDECFAQGTRATTDNNIRNTGSGITSYGGKIGGFVYSNEALINDCYSNLPTSTSSYMAGFVYVDSATSIINRCYSISYKLPGDNNTTTFPFVGASNLSFIPKVVVNGTLNNCYFLKSGTDWSVEDMYFYTSLDSEYYLTPNNKKAIGLTYDNFATHDSFVNFDMSLVYNSASYANRNLYNFVDGYTWVIVEGKPVIVSTQVKTISQQDYMGKLKNYLPEESVYFDINNFEEFRIETQELTGAEQGKIKKSYYDDTTLIYSTTEKQDIENKESVTGEIVYEFEPRNGNKYLKIVCSYKDIDSKRELTFKSSEVNQTNSTILDIKLSKDEDYVDVDSNFRANDTIFVSLDENGAISKIIYKTLASASYAYNDRAENISDRLGTRTNPKIIKDYKTFNYYLTRTSENIGFYRLVSDIDLDNQFVPTSKTTFIGVLQGNYMQIDNLALSYYNDTLSSDEPISFGLFSKIETRTDSGTFVTGGYKDTIISNITINVNQVLSNAHSYVGALAGQIVGYSNRKVFMNNISIASQNNYNSFVIGRNAVGGLAGYVTGNVIIKDISTNISCNATYDEITTSNMLYINKDNNSLLNYSYCGGVIGIFDCETVVDTATQRNYNANNVVVAGENIYVGNIVGSAFGLIGENTLVNYTNCYVTDSSNSFLKAISYSGGIVGENRGILQASSIGYQNQDVAINQVGSTNERYSYFYSNTTSPLIAIGGLVGFNNGGFISNCISSINVCNPYATIAGGAVGRAVEGGFSKVITTGSVLANKIIGGLIGSINNRTIMTNIAGYNQQAIMSIIDREGNYKSAYSKIFDSTTVGATDTIIFDGCIAGNNYLSKDYDYYTGLMSKTGTNMGLVGGFVGVIAYPKEGTALPTYHFDYKDNSYYVNTLYSVPNASEVSKYINAVNYSYDYDIMTDNDNLGAKTVLGDETSQKVLPYSTSEFYYESQTPNCSYSITTYVNSNAGNSTENDLYAQKVYTISSTSPSYLLNDNQFYKLIDKSNWNAEYKARNYEWYKDRFGRFFYKDGETYNLIQNSEEYDLVLGKVKEEGSTIESGTDEDDNVIPKFYYVFTTIINNFQFSKTFNTDKNSILFFNNEDKIEFNGLISENYTDITNCHSLMINGLKFDFESMEQVSVDTGTEEETTVFNSITYKIIQDFELPSGAIISAIQFEIVRLETDPVRYEAKNFVVTFDYTVDESPDSFIKLTSNSNNAVTNYSLNVASKQVIYNSFDNGYWSFGDNFYSKSFTSADILPVNLEYSKKYIWSEFTSNLEAEVDENTATFTISSAEELAFLAKVVNDGELDDVLNNLNSENPFEKVNFILDKNIDLSGKYWVPIGNQTHPFGSDDFAITFDGQNNDIKYVSVNESSNYGNVVEYAGLFGKVAGEKGITICNLKIKGGEVNGIVSGGLVGEANNCTIYNIINRNNAIGSYCVGGIVGKANESNIYQCTNYANVQNTNYAIGYNNIFVGGIVGQYTSTSTANYSKIEDYDENSTNNFGKIILDGENIVELPNQNYGEIKVNNSSNNYIASTPILINFYIGGLVGSAKQINFVSTQINYGDITCKNNAHSVVIGGAVGKIDNCYNVCDLKNDGDINFVSDNICADVREFESEVIDYNDSRVAKFDIGGVIGLSNTSIDRLANLANISLQTSASYANASIGGVVGRTCINNANMTISQSYNIGEIGLQSHSYTVFGIGGVVGVINKVSSSSNYVTISDNYNAGKIHSTNYCKTYLGGILGYVATQTSSSSALIKNCLNVGYITIYDIIKSNNALGAIVGYIANCYTQNVGEDLNLYNFYLSSSAFSSSEIYGAYTQIISNKFESSDSDVFAKSRISQNLKVMDTYAKQQAGEVLEIEYAWDFVNVWVLKYDTWYPTLRQNQTTSYWVDYQETVEKLSGVYAISNAEELAYIANEINSGKLDTTGVTIKLTNYIDLSNKFFTPIGTNSYPFKGVFDGDNYIIKNLTVDENYKIINRDSTFGYYSNYGGVFGYCENAQIINLGVEAPNVKNVDYASGIVARAKNSKLSNLFADMGESIDCYVSGQISTGGLCGELKDSNNNTTNLKTGLYFSYNDVAIKADKEDGICVVGGLVGQLINSYISNSYNNSKGIVTVRSEGLPNVASSVIAGSIDNDCRIINVFNLAKSYLSLTNPDESKPITEAMYSINLNDETGKKALSAMTLTPSFENLENSPEGNKDDIWTREYTLNKGSDYPSLRSLSKDWKNTQSEPLIVYEVNALNFNNVKNTILDKLDGKKYDDEGNINSEYTLVNFANESFNITTNVIQKIYLISNVQDLIWVANSINSGNLITRNCEFILLNDIDLSGRYWTPIGLSSTYAFQGIFNFNGHVIKGLTIDKNNYVYAGLFGYTKDAYIVNGYLDDCFIKVNNNISEIQTYVGTLVGYSEDTTIRNMIISTNISVTSKSTAYVGGVVGLVKNVVATQIDNVRVYGNTNGIYLSKYQSQVVEIVNESGEGAGEIKSNNINIGVFSDYDKVYLGGIAGFVFESEREIATNIKTISYAYCDINLAGVSLSSSSNVYVGGIVGYGKNIKVDSSKMDGIVKSYSAKFDIVGGIVGYSYYGEVENCQFSGYLESRQASGRASMVEQNIRSYLGGIIGACEGGVVSYCYMSGSTTSIAVDKDITAGGIIGYARYKSINDDNRCVYDQNASNGFEDVLGIGVYYPSEIIIDSSEKYVTDTSSITNDNGFVDTLWKDKSLVNKKIYVVGSGKSSFVATYPENKNLLNGGGLNVEPGIYLTDISTLKLTNLETIGGKIGISIVVENDNNINYQYVEANLPSPSIREFSLSSYLEGISGIALSKLIACYVTYVAPTD